MAFVCPSELPESGVQALGSSKQLTCMWANAYHSSWSDMGFFHACGYYNQIG